MPGDNQPNGPQDQDGMQLPTSVSGKPIAAAWSVPLTEEEVKAKEAQKPATIVNAMSTIKTEDFSNVVNTPCARNGFLTGIIAGAAGGGLRIVVRGNWTQAANWAVGMFVLGSASSFEYCQFLRRAEKRNMQRAVEIHTESKRQQAKALAEQKKLDEERKASEKRWYKFW